MEYKFPNGFKWGSATSAHQVEGNNHNDWTSQCRDCSRVEPKYHKLCIPCAGQACDSYDRYEEDFDIIKQLNQNIHRFSIEWSRIEPEEGKFNFEAIKHYEGLVKSLRGRGIEPMVTLWHFTNPIWFAKKGGFLNKKAPEYFTRYVKYVVDNLKDKVGLWITFNEAASVYAGFSYLNGQWPPQHRNIFEYLRVRKNFIKAQALAYRTIKDIYNDMSTQSTLCNTSDVSHNSDFTTSLKVAKSHNIMQHNDMSHNIVSVGLVENNTHSVHGNRWYEKIVGKIYNYQRNLYFWDKALPYYDFLGLNYYHADSKGIYHRLMELKKFKKPIYITENGIADATDQKRAKFIKEHLYWVWRAIQDGADIKGYLYWSLLDNFEWAKGFTPRFGLVEVDYNTFERKIRPSAWQYAEICKTNTLNYDI